jgi:ABC-type uncharacterized transport system YnjBCD substrate-binding protein
MGVLERSARKDVAMVVVNFLISPEAQLRKFTLLESNTFRIRPNFVERARLPSFEKRLKNVHYL